MEEENEKEKAHGNDQNHGENTPSENTPSENTPSESTPSDNIPSDITRSESGDENIEDDENLHLHPHKKRPSRLYRSYKLKIIMGVCGGMGEYFNVDPVVFRLLFILSLLLGGWGVLAYVLVSILVPYDPDELAARWKTGDRLLTETEEKKDNSRMIMGAFLILLGLFTFLKTTGMIRYFSFFGLTNEILIPFILVAMGILLIYRFNYLSRQDAVEEEDRPVPEQLYRSNDNRLAAGVCGGLGAYLSADANLIRFIWLVLTFTTLGAGLILYIMFALFVPKEKEAVTIEE